MESTEAIIAWLLVIAVLLLIGTLAHRVGKALGRRARAREYRAAAASAGLPFKEWERNNRWNGGPYS